jgi:hypothetical protein
VQRGAAPNRPVHESAPPKQELTSPAQGTGPPTHVSRDELQSARVSAQSSISSHDSRAWLKHIEYTRSHLSMLGPSGRVWEVGQAASLPGA